MADLSGLAAFGGGFANAMPEAQRRYLALQQQQMELDQARRAIMAQRAAMSGFGGGDPGLGNLPGAQPLPGAAAPPQGGPAMQATPGQMALRPGPQGLVPAQGAPPLQGPMPGAQPQPGPQMGGGPQMPIGGTLTVEQLAERIRQRNPGIDGATLFQAVQQAAALLNPESKLLLNYLISQQRIGAQERGQDIRADTTVRGQDVGAASREKVAGIGAASRESVAAQSQAGQDRRLGTKLSTVSEQTKYVQDQINKRLATTGGAKAAKDMAKAHLDGLKAERQQILDQARETGGVTTPEQTAALNKVNQAITDFQRQNARLIGAGAVTLTPKPGGASGPMPPADIQYDAQGNRVGG